MSSVTPLLGLPEELWVRIFSLYFDISSLPRISRVCSKWHALIDDAEVWRTIHCRTFCISSQWLGSEPSPWRKHAIAAHKAVTDFWKGKSKTSTNHVSFGTSLYRQTFLNESLGIFNQGVLFQVVPEAVISRQCSLANILLKLKKFQEALRAIDQALDVAPVHEKSLVIRGNIFLEMRRFEEARTSFLAASASGANIEALLGCMSVSKELKEEAEFNRLKEEIRHGNRLINSILRAKFYALYSSVDCCEYAQEALDAGAQTDLAAYLAAISREDICRRALQDQKKEAGRYVPHFEMLNEVKKLYEQSIKSNPFHLKVILSYINFLEYEIEIRSELDSRFYIEQIKEIRERINTHLAAAVLLNREYPETYFLIGRNLCLLGKLQEAKENLLKAKELGCLPEKLYVFLIQVLLKEEIFTPALAEKISRESYIKFGTREIALLFCQVIIKQPLNIAKHAEAEKILTQQIEQNSEDSDSLILLAQIFKLQKKYKEAEENYRKAHALIKNIKTSSQSGTVLMKEQDLKKLNDIHAIHMGIMECLHLRGETEMSRNYPPTAVQEYMPQGSSQAVELLLYHFTERATPDLLLCLGDVYQAQHRELYYRPDTPAAVTTELVRKREEAYQRAIDIDPQYVDAYLRLVEMSLNLEKFDQAKNYIEKILTVDPTHCKAIDFFIQIILEQRAILLCPEGMRLAKVAIEKLRDQAEGEFHVRDFYMRWIQLYAIEGSLDQSQEAFIGFFNHSSHFAFESLQGGKIRLFNSQNREEFIDGSDVFACLMKRSREFQEGVCRSVLEKDPNHFAMQCLMGHLLVERKEGKQAAIHWELALTITEERQYRRAILIFLLEHFYSLGELEKAVTFANQLIWEVGTELQTDFLVGIAKKFPHNLIIQNNLGAILFFRKEYPTAQACCANTLAIDPKHPKARSLMHHILNELGQKEEAKVYLDPQAAPQGNPGAFFSFFHLEDFLEKPK